MMDVQALGCELRLGPDGVWYGADTPTLSYPLDGHDACFDVEDGSFWFRHRNACITTIVKRFPPRADEAIVDIGGGNGFVALGLEAAGFDVVLLEPSASGAANAKKRGLRHVVCATTESAKIAPDSLAAVGLFDVIEHIEDDIAFLRAIRRLVHPGGRLYATVPAYACLWSAEDVAAGHFRRYSTGALRRVLAAAGFNVEYSSYTFRPLPLPILLLRALPFWLGLSTSRKEAKHRLRAHATGAGWTKTVLNLLLHSEIENLSVGRSMRFGGSCLVVAKAA